MFSLKNSGSMDIGQKSKEVTTSPIRKRNSGQEHTLNLSQVRDPLSATVALALVGGLLTITPTQ